MYVYSYICACRSQTCVQNCPGFITLAPMKLYMRRSLRIYLYPSTIGQPVKESTRHVVGKIGADEAKNTTEEKSLNSIENV